MHAISPVSPCSDHDWKDSRLKITRSLDRIEYRLSTVSDIRRSSLPAEDRRARSYSDRVSEYDSALGSDDGDASEAADDDVDHEVEHFLNDRFVIEGNPWSNGRDQSAANREQALSEDERSVQEMIQAIDRALSKADARFSDSSSYSPDTSPALNDFSPIPALGMVTAIRARSSSPASISSQVSGLQFQHTRSHSMELLSRRCSVASTVVSESDLPIMNTEADDEETAVDTVEKKRSTPSLRISTEEVNNLRLPRARDPLGIIYTAMDSPTDPWKSVFFKTVEPPPPPKPASPSQASRTGSWDSGAFSEPVSLTDVREEYFDWDQKEVVPEEKPEVSCRIESVGTLDFPEFMPMDDEEEEEKKKEEAPATSPRNRKVSNGDYYVPARSGKVDTAATSPYPRPSAPTPITSSASRDPLSISRESMRQHWSEKPGVNLILSRSRSRSTSPENSSTSRSPPVRSYISAERLTRSSEDLTYRKKAIEKVALWRRSPPLAYVGKLGPTTSGWL